MDIFARRGRGGPASIASLLAVGFGNFIHNLGGPRPFDPQYILNAFHLKLEKRREIYLGDYSAMISHLHIDCFRKNTNRRPREAWRSPGDSIALSMNLPLLPLSPSFFFLRTLSSPFVSSNLINHDDLFLVIPFIICFGVVFFTIELSKRKKSS